MVVETVGFLAALAMVLTYALEERGPGYVLGFAIACACAVVYATLIGSWPFALLESVWSLLALRRWRRRSREGKPRGHGEQETVG